MAVVVFAGCQYPRSTGANIVGMARQIGWDEIGEMKAWFDEQGKGTLGVSDGAGGIATFDFSDADTAFWFKMMFFKGDGRA
jgi:hypothetical protein